MAQICLAGRGERMDGDEVKQYHRCVVNGRVCVCVCCASLSGAVLCVRSIDDRSVEGCNR